LNLTEDILAQVKKGKRKAQKEMYRVCFPHYMGIASRFCVNREDAVELVNVAFVKIFDNLTTIPTVKDFIPWSKRIVTNECINNYRKQKRQITTTVDYEIEDYFAAIDSPNKSKEIAEKLKPQIMKMLQKLPPATLEVFTLYVFEGLTHQEIADYVEISEGTSKWHLNNARKILKDKVEAKLKVLLHEEF